MILNFVSVPNSLIPVLLYLSSKVTPPSDRRGIRQREKLLNNKRLYQRCLNNVAAFYYYNVCTHRLSTGMMHENINVCSYTGIIDKCLSYRRETRATKYYHCCTISENRSCVSLRSTFCNSHFHLDICIVCTRIVVRSSTIGQRECDAPHHIHVTLIARIMAYSHRRH